MSLPAWLAAPLLLATLALAGWGLASRLPGTRLQRWVVGFLAGCVLLHLWLTLLDALGLRWSQPLALAPLAAAATLGWWLAGRRARGASEPPRPTARPGWGDLLALAALAGFLALAWTLWITTPDFVYHWGLKAHRFLLAGHVDYGYLAQQQGWVLHPDYPNLVPELLAVTALLGGAWSEQALVLWSPLLMMLVLLSARELLALERLPAFERQAVVAFLGLGCGTAAIGWLVAGGADWFPALALLVALPALLAPPDATGDLQLGLCAAFAAAAKQEGMLLAAGLVGVQLARHLLRRVRPELAGLAALMLPPAVVVACWGARVARYHLLQSYDKGIPSLERLPLVLSAIGRDLVSSPWHGLPLLLLLLPLLLAAPRLRPFVVVAGLQLVAYVATCTAQPDRAHVDLLVVTTFDRFALQLFPATVTAAAVAWLGARETGEGG